jgi:hypothetical protein
MNMENKQQILAGLQKVFNRWQEILPNLSEAQISSPLSPSTWTVIDIVAHMWAWQQASVARAEAAVHNKEPNYPEWWKTMGPDPEEDVDRTNAYLYETNLGRAWSSVYADWRAQFLHYLELLEQITEKDLLEPGRYKWMGKYALVASSMGSLEHHQEHLEPLLAWLQEHGNSKTSR